MEICLIGDREYRGWQTAGHQGVSFTFAQEGWIIAAFESLLVRHLHLELGSFAALLNLARALTTEPILLLILKDSETIAIDDS